MSTRLDRLTRSIENASSDIERSCAKAVLAAYLGRSGQYQRAKDLVAEIRTSPINVSARLSALVMFAEAMFLLQDKLNPQGVDRLQRGYVLALAASVNDVAALNASWLVHCTYNLNQYGEMAGWLEKCRQLSSSLDLDAEIRLALTFAAMDRYLGDFAASDGWYKLARARAVSLADEAYLSASMYNRPAYGIARLRFLDSSGVLVQDRDTLIRQLTLEIESAVNYSFATRNRSNLHLQSLWTARLQMLEDRFADALPQLLVSRVEMPEARHRRELQLVEADLCLCEAKLGQRNHSSATRALADADLGALETDDRAVFLAQLCASAEAEGDLPLVDSIRPLLHDAVAKHEEFLSSLRAMVSTDWHRERLELSSR